MKYIYLASPYSHPDPDVRSDRAAAAMAVAVDLMRAGLAVFSPMALLLTLRGRPDVEPPHSHITTDSAPTTPT